MTEDTALAPGYDFKGDTFDLNDAGDRDIVCFMLSQALYGEATGVYCGKSLYAAVSLEAARFYLRQARQELNHLELFADVFRILGLQPQPAHWVVKLLSSHNNYYPLKVFMEHAIGEGLVLDIFKDVLLQTLPDDDERVPEIKKRLRVVVKEEMEHVAWGEKETRRLLAERPRLRTPMYGLLEIQLALLPFIVRAFESRISGHRVLRHLPAFVAYTRERVWGQAVSLGLAPAERPGAVRRLGAMIWGASLFLRSQLSRSQSRLEKIYLSELGFQRP